MHAQVVHLEDGFDGMQGSWGFEEQFYYQMKNLGPNPETGKPRKYVEWKVGPFGDIWYDHGDRNENQKDVMGKNREQFEKIAEEKGLKSGHYSAMGAAFHEPNSGIFILRMIKGLFTGNFPNSTVDKMWMQDGDIHWWQIPSVEGLFTKSGEYYSAPSYNYGNNLVSHFFLDMIPGWIMGYEPDKYK